MDKTGYVYTLLLEDNCYYVGYSQDAQVRICSHFLGAGSKWTILHKPKEIISICPGDTLLETLKTLALMCKYGFEKVRGGSYTNIEMKEPACLKQAKHYATYYKGDCND